MRARPTFVRMLTMRSKGVYRQYMLSGVGIYDILAYNFIVDFIFSSICNMGFLAFTPIYKLSLDGIWLPLLLSSVSIPIYHSYFFITTEGMPEG
jgi:hypothetical protein